MPNLGAPELIIIFIVILLVAVPIVVVVGVISLTRRSGQGQGLAPAVAPPGWLSDPSRRHQYRYWDGMQWTAAVSDDGAQSSDPL